MKLAILPMQPRTETPSLENTKEKRKDMARGCAFNVQRWHAHSPIKQKSHIVRKESLGEAEESQT